MSRPERRMTIAVDFDGVIHSATTHEYPFDPLKVLDPPVPGMLPWLIGLVRDPRFKVAIFSTRVGQGGVPPMEVWLMDNGVPEEIVDQLEFTLEKPAAHLIIDDRAMQFTGHPIPVEDIVAFRPWNRA